MSTLNEIMTAHMDAVREKTGATGALSIESATVALNNMQPSTGSALEIYVCSEARMTASGSRSIIVSGAGSTDCNGTYTYGGTDSEGYDYWTYTSSSTTYYILYIYGDGFAQWTITTSKPPLQYDTAGDLYRSKMGEGATSPYDATGWDRSMYGTAPTPTVELYTTPPTWDGYAVEYSDAGWKVSDTLTTDMVAEGFTPVVGDAYTADTKIHVEDIDGILSGGAVFVVSGITDSYSGANGNYFQYNEGEGSGTNAIYKHETEEYYIYVEQLHKKYWVLDNTLDLGSSTWPDMWRYRTSEEGLTNPYSDTGSLSWLRGGTGKPATTSTMVTTKG